MRTFCLRNLLKGIFAMEKKKGINVAALAAGAVAVCLVAIVAVLAVKATKSKNEVDIQPVENSVQEVVYSEYESSSAWEDYTEPTSEAESVTDDITTTIQQVVTTVRDASTSVTQKIAESTTEKKTEKKTEEDVTIPEVTSTEVSKASEASVASASNWKDLPRDMTFAGLSTQGYSVVGLKQYIYNDDMASDCTQRKFGYNSLYDSGAKLIDFTIDTVKFKFNYDGKTYRIQLWKGQYISGDIGTFGGEVGIYTHNGENFAGDHFDCAGEGDELYMEMTMLYDEELDGVYVPQLTRNYALHWWETGYVDGQLHNKKDSSSLRLLNRITFKDETQAKAFASSMKNKGFTEVSTFDPTVPDTFKRYGKEVIYIWWNVR